MNTSINSFASRNFINCFGNVNGTVVEENIFRSGCFGEESFFGRGSGSDDVSAESGT